MPEQTLYAAKALGTETKFRSKVQPETKFSFQRQLRTEVRQNL